MLAKTKQTLGRVNYCSLKLRSFKISQVTGYKRANTIFWFLII